MNKQYFSLFTYGMKCKFMKRDKRFIYIKKIFLCMFHVQNYRILHVYVLYILKREEEAVMTEMNHYVVVSSYLLEVVW